MPGEDLGVVMRLVGWLVAVVAGYVAMWIAGRELSPPPDVYQREFVLHRDSGDPLRVTEAKHVMLPQRFGDVDITMTVELPEAGELDLVLRQATPRLARDAEGHERWEPFHSRFSLLRLSTLEEGPPYRTREEALFDDGLSGGVKLRGGVPSTIKVEARGRRLRANVAGRWFPWIEATDRTGGIAFVVRGGTAIVSYLKITPQVLESFDPTWYAVIGGLVASLILFLAGAGAIAVIASSALLVPLGGALAGWALFAHLLPGVRPDDGAFVLGAFCGWPLAVAVAAVRKWWAWPLGLLAMLFVLECAASSERPRLRGFEDPRLDEHFGPDSSTAPFDALVRRVPLAAGGWFTGATDDRVVLMLGGGAVFEAGDDLEHHAALRVPVELRVALGGPVSGLVAPPVEADPLQQAACFDRFYAGLDVDVVWFAVTGRERAEKVVGEPAAITLWELWSPRARAGASVDDVVAAVQRVVAACRREEIPLVLATDTATDPMVRTRVEALAGVEGVPFLGNVLTRTGRPRLEATVEMLAESLR